MIASVTDSGAGLSDDELARVFDPFYTVKGEGMGIGLSICRAIVAAHGGTIDALRNSGKGMTFSVMFPYWHTDTAAQSAQRRDHG
jgi:signal transduction histidine kinase